MALGARAGRDALPGACWDPPEQIIGAVGVARGDDPVVTGHRQHIADTSGLQLGPQRRVGTVDLIAGHPGGRHAGVQRPGDRRLGQGRLGGKPDLLGYARGRQAFRISGPASRHLQFPVDHRVPGSGGIDQVDRDLSVLDAARGAGVLALHPHRLDALLEVPSLIHHQHRPGIAQMLDHIVAQVIADRVLIPHRPSEQVLQPIRAGIAGVLGDRPAVLGWQLGQQPSTNALARRRGSTRPNRPASRPNNSSSPTCHLAGSTSTLWPAATV
jgi:hypothetical protein